MGLFDRIKRAFTARMRLLSNSVNLNRLVKIRLSLKSTIRVLRRHDVLSLTV